MTWKTHMEVDTIAFHAFSMYSWQEQPHACVVQTVASYPSRICWAIAEAFWLATLFLFANCFGWNYLCDNIWQWVGQDIKNGNGQDILCEWRTRDEPSGATQEREKIQRSTKQKVAGWHSKWGGSCLEHDSIGQTALEGVGWGLLPAGDRQCFCESKNERQTTCAHS